MEVKLVSLTRPETLIPYDPKAELHTSPRKMSPEELLVYIARVSNPGNQENMDSAAKLLTYLISNQHWSPFDMVNLTVEVKTSRAVAAQILRHWSIKPQEFSQRYAKATEVEPIELRLKGSTNRQGSLEWQSEDELKKIRLVQATTTGRYTSVIGTARELVDAHVANSLELYNALVDAGYALECARMILPLATTTTLYLNGSVRSWIHYLQQRLDAHAQKEHRLVATAISKIFKKHFPNVWAAIVTIKAKE